MKQRSIQVPVLIVGVLGWSLWGEPAVWALIASYAVAWALCNWTGWAGLASFSGAPAAVRTGVIALVVAGPLMLLAQTTVTMATREGLLGIADHVADRLRLEDTPAIAPPVVFADHPQTFYVHASGAERLKVAVGEAPRDAVSLGAGLFRLEYDPRRDGAPTGRVVLDVDGHRVEREMQVERPSVHPRWFSSLARFGLAATVSEETDELIVVLRDGSVRRFEVGDGPTDVALISASLGAVSHRYDPAIWIVGLESGEVEARVEVGFFQRRIAASDDGVGLAVAMGGESAHVALVNRHRDGVTRVPMPATPDWLAFGDGALVVSGLETRSVYRVRDTSAGWALDERRLPLGRPVVVATERVSDGVWVVATTAYRADGEMPTGNHFVQDQLLTIDVAALEVVDRLVTGRGGEAQDDPGNVESGGSPLGIEALSSGGYLVAMAGTDEVWRWGSGESLVRVALDVRARDLPLWAPHGVADLGEGRFAVASPFTGTIGVFEHDGSVVAIHPLAPSDEALASEPQDLARRRGARTFYESTRSGASCQSCHTHGGHDYSLHDLTPKGHAPLPMKPTLSTMGIAGTSPYLRDGSFPRISDLHGVAAFRYRGFARAERDRAADLARFVDSLPLPLNPRALEGRDGQRERSGAAAFVRARCNACHAFPAFTNLGQHAVRAVFPDYGAILQPEAGVDTPSLLAQISAPPYLYDGRAGTLRDVVGVHNPENRHGDTQALSPEEIDDLIYFLESL